MGQVVPFIARVRDSGDWSATERARLQDLADRLAAGGVHVEVIFGATDEGDPWCVVTDADGDVLIHVARIDGKFVVHSAVDDAVNENVDLHAALRGSLDATEDAFAPRSATILSFGLTARQGQTFLALLAATAFFYETAAVGDTAEAAAPVHLLPPDEPPPPPPEADSPTQERENAQGVALQPTDAGPAPMLVDAPAPVVAPREPQDDSPPPMVATPTLAPAPKGEMTLAPTSPAGPALTIRGTAGDDLLVGSSADEHLVGGAGNDTLRGGGGHDLLEGGAGDDVLEVTGLVTAVGGAGADTFVIQAPVQLGHADTLLGVILDFSTGEGDRLLNWAGTAIRLSPPHGGDTDKQAPPTTDGGDFTGQVTPNPPTTTTTDPQPDPGQPAGGGAFGPTLIGPAPPLTRVDVDLDGDGVVDGYLLFGSRGHLVEPPITATVGAGLGAADPVG